MLVGREIELKDDLTWNPPTWPLRGARGEISSSYKKEKKCNLLLGKALKRHNTGGCGECFDMRLGDIFIKPK